MLEVPVQQLAFTFTGENRMSNERSFTVSNFYEFIKEKRLMAIKCNSCGTMILPPQPMCTNCLSTKLTWVEIEGSGKLLSYTVIYVAPEQFQSLVPYIIGIVEFEKGLRLPGMVRNVDPEELIIGMNLKINFDTSSSSQWHTWSRYFFTPL